VAKGEIPIESTLSGNWLIDLENKKPNFQIKKGGSHENPTKDNIFS
jgi:hypothetical protein